MTNNNRLSSLSLLFGQGLIPHDFELLILCLFLNAGFVRLRFITSLSFFFLFSFPISNTTSRVSNSRERELAKMLPAKLQSRHFIICLAFTVESCRGTVKL